MTTECCAYCGRPIPATLGERIGVVRFCARACIASWFSLPLHDRRVHRESVVIERRAS